MIRKTAHCTEDTSLRSTLSFLLSEEKETISLLLVSSTFDLYRLIIDISIDSSTDLRGNGAFPHSLLPAISHKNFFCFVEKEIFILHDIKCKT